ncbi:peroxide stress protein YaaA [Pseudoclavibacter chungangensis]|uniref:Peroxide stress protein YaaA n=1 Tax=Pseudoclavibacter chungangensis TaxID=587635 RepID=A0A7J5BSR9_9MICO|nr:peroxide stress protein YaaA [Pseudoclavibacter chungangensis]
MLLLLPPSETKRDGGNAASGPSLVDAPADGTALSWPQLDGVRAGVVDDLVALSADPAAAAAALKISARLAESELERNRSIRSAPRLAAVDRYTGVLFDALDAGSLGRDARAWLEGHVAVQSACFGLVGVGEGIPAYRLSAGSRLPGATLRQRWAAACRTILADHDGLVVDLRSKGYAALGPLPASAVVPDVVTREPNGTTRALGHFNKHGKGAFVRALAERLATSGDEPTTAAGLVAAAAAAGFELEVDGAVSRLVLPAP